LGNLSVTGSPFGASATFNFTDTNANVLAAPRIRTRDNQKARS